MDTYFAVSYCCGSSMEVWIASNTYKTHTKLQHLHIHRRKSGALNETLAKTELWKENPAEKVMSTQPFIRGFFPQFKEMEF